MPSVRRTLKGAAERLLTVSGLALLARRQKAGRCLVLAFHNVVAPGHHPGGDRPLHLALDDFERFLDQLTRTHDVVALDAVESAPTGGRPRAAITLDDAYAAALRYGVPALVSRGLPATIFVAPGILGRSACWWDRLAVPMEGLPSAVRDHALAALRGEDEAIARWAEEEGLPSGSLQEDWRIATERELAEAAVLPGVTLGAHTWSHPNLAALGPDEATRQMERPLSWLRERFPSARPWIAYPYGITTPLVARAAGQAGYALGFRVSGGWVAAPAKERLELPRLSIPAGLSQYGFILHTSGFFKG